MAPKDVAVSLAELLRKSPFTVHKIYLSRRLHHGLETPGTDITPPYKIYLSRRVHIPFPKTPKLLQPPPPERHLA